MIIKYCFIPVYKHNDITVVYYRTNRFFLFQNIFFVTDISPYGAQNLLTSNGLKKIHNSLKSNYNRHLIHLMNTHILFSR